jgi:RNA 2',3'-cyclic 3'-phosphodiesterase
LRHTASHTRADPGVSFVAVSDRQTTGGGSERLFIALELPDQVRERIVAWQRRAMGPALRAVRREGLHLTLAFLGDRAAAELARAADIVARLEPHPVPITLDPEPVPVPRRRPRLYAFAADSPAAEAMHEGLADRLGRERLYRRPGHPFWPHVTALRVRGPKGGAGSRPKVPGEALGDAHAFGAVRVALYRSELGPDGSRYEDLAHVELPPIEDAA